jgi:hypothetical protein
LEELGQQRLIPSSRTTYSVLYCVVFVDAPGVDWPPIPELTTTETSPMEKETLVIILGFRDGHVVVEFDL